MTVARASVYAVTVQATVEYGSGLPGSPKTTWKVGSATLTTVMSRIDMMAPSTTTPAILRTAPSILSGYTGGAVCAGADDTLAPCPRVRWWSAGRPRRRPLRGGGPDRLRQRCRRSSVPHLTPRLETISASSGHPADREYVDVRIGSEARS